MAKIKNLAIFFLLNSVCWQSATAHDSDSGHAHADDTAEVPEDITTDNQQIKQQSPNLTDADSTKSDQVVDSATEIPTENDDDDGIKEEPGFCMRVSDDEWPKYVLQKTANVLSQGSECKEYC